MAVVEQLETLLTIYSAVKSCQRNATMYLYEYASRDDY